MDLDVFDYLSSVETDLADMGRDRTIKALKHYEKVSSFLFRWNNSNYLLLNLIRILKTFIKPSFIFGRGKVTTESINFYLDQNIKISEITFDDYD